MTRAYEFLSGDRKGMNIETRKARCVNLDNNRACEENTYYISYYIALLAVFSGYPYVVEKIGGGDRNRTDE